MIDLYHQFSSSTSKSITHTYSTSFTLGIKMLDKQLHEPIYGIYGLVRLADEIVDSFHGFDKENLLQSFVNETYTAMESGISTNPVIHSFQKVAKKYNIEKSLVEAFFESMAMDLDNTCYDEENYNSYIYGSAEVVGLMCLKVFTEGNAENYLELKDGAKYLGAAFQKVNFLRDIQDDFEDKGRTYFPGVDFNSFAASDKKKIETDINNDFSLAYDAILKLPRTSRKGVYLAYVYYKSLYQKIEKAPPEAILKARFRVPNLVKIMILLKVNIKHFFKLI